MKIYAWLALALGFVSSVCAEQLIPSALDPALAVARDKALTPWMDSGKSSETWAKLSKTCVPIYCERNDGNMQRELYIPNPGIAYWVLGGLTEKNLFKINREKNEIEDTLVSASAYKDTNGFTSYWALWAPKNRAYLLTEQLKALGISQARIELTLFDRAQILAGSLNVYSGFFTLLIIPLLMIFMFRIVNIGEKLVEQTRRKE